MIKGSKYKLLVDGCSLNTIELKFFVEIYRNHGQIQL